jgi:hypothetical protein
MRYTPMHQTGHGGLLPNTGSVRQVPAEEAGTRDQRMAIADWGTAVGLGLNLRAGSWRLWCASTPHVESPAEELC